MTLGYNSPFFSRIEFGWEFRVKPLGQNSIGSHPPDRADQYLVAQEVPYLTWICATQRRSTSPNATSGGHLPRFARPDCAIQPVRTVPTTPSSQIYNRRERGAGCS